MNQRWETGRVEAFSDGVFAIAITLLVLDIKIEPSQFDDLWRALGEEWPSYLAYVTSFLTVGGVWLAHHGLFSRLQAVDPVLMRLNLLLLMAVSFLPFPTGAHGRGAEGPSPAERAAVVVYGATAARSSRCSWRPRGATPPRGRASGRPLGASARDRPTPSRHPARRPLWPGHLRRDPRAAQARRLRVLLVAALSVLSARGEGRLTLRGPPG